MLAALYTPEDERLTSAAAEALRSARRDPTPELLRALYPTPSPAPPAGVNRHFLDAASPPRFGFEDEPDGDMQDAVDPKELEQTAALAAQFAAESEEGEHSGSEDPDRRPNNWEHSSDDDARSHGCEESISGEVAFKWDETSAFGNLEGRVENKAFYRNFGLRGSEAVGRSAWVFGPKLPRVLVLRLWLRLRLRHMDDFHQVRIRPLKARAALHLPHELSHPPLLVFWSRRVPSASPPYASMSPPYAPDPPSVPRVPRVPPPRTTPSLVRAMPPPRAPRAASPRWPLGARRPSPHRRGVASPHSQHASHACPLSRDARRRRASCVVYRVSCISYVVAITYCTTSPHPRSDSNHSRTHLGRW
jgi:hypothetical protein